MSSLVRGKSVLDVGCVEHSAELEMQDTWLHKHLRNSSARIVGLDYEAEHVAELQRRGYNIIAGDAMTVDLSERFDVVTAGEIIEHVENPGMLVQNLKRHLNPGGILVLSTPNVFYPFHLIEALTMNPAVRWNSEHVSWYDHFTLQNLLMRCGFRDVQGWYLTRSRKIRSVLSTLNAPCPAFLASTIVVVART